MGAAAPRCSLNARSERLEAASTRARVGRRPSARSRSRTTLASVGQSRRDVRGRRDDCGSSRASMSLARVETPACRREQRRCGVRRVSAAARIRPRCSERTIKRGVGEWSASSNGSCQPRGSSTGRRIAPVCLGPVSDRLGTARRHATPVGAPVAKVSTRCCGRPSSLAQASDSCPTSIKSPRRVSVR